MNYDAQCEAAVAGAPGTAVAWWLMASFLYYHRDKTIVSDGCFDSLSRLIESSKDKRIKKHPHRSLIKAGEDGRITSGYYLLERDYPSICRSAALSLLDGHPSTTERATESAKKNALELALEE